MAVRPILTFPDPRLETPCAPVAAVDDALAALIEDLRDTLAAAGGLGLSAPQLGASVRVALTNADGEAASPTVFVNPEIVARKRWGLVEESCLSIPGVVGNVFRATRVRVRALDEAGRPVERELEDMAAVSLQHELDHLDGKLFIDRLSPFRRWRIRARAKAAAKAHAAA